MIAWLEKNRSISIILTILITIEIFYFSTLKGGTGTGANPLIAPAYHFIVFFLFCFFFLIAIKGKGRLKTSHIIIVLVISILHAVLDEVHQMFVLFRNSSVKDILIDSLGIFSAVMVYKYWDKKHKN